MRLNGPAIWGGCVTRRQHRDKAVPVQEGYGVVFAIRVQVLSNLGVLRYNVERSQKTITVQNYY
jgi:hypothetical protein